MSYDSNLISPPPIDPEKAVASRVQPTDETRFYIGLTKGGLKVQLVVGPGPADSFNYPAYQPFGNAEVTYYQVSEQVAESYLGGDDDDLGTAYAELPSDDGFDLTDGDIRGLMY